MMKTAKKVLRSVLPAARALSLQVQRVIFTPDRSRQDPRIAAKREYQAACSVELVFAGDEVGDSTTLLQALEEGKASALAQLADIQAAFEKGPEYAKWQYLQEDLKRARAAELENETKA